MRKIAFVSLVLLVILILNVNFAGAASTSDSNCSVDSKLKLGSRDRGGDDDVACLQMLLGLKADGIFGKITQAAVLEFQASAELKTDGVVGPRTTGALMTQANVETGMTNISDTTNATTNVSAVESQFSDQKITTTYSGNKLEVKTCTNFAGAICSVKLNNRELVDREDHGRLLQNALTYAIRNAGGQEALSECYNPTEGGGSASPSTLLENSLIGNTIHTKSQMAFWFSKDANIGYCANHPFLPANFLSNVFMEKDISLGYRDIPNVIVYKGKFSIPNEPITNGKMMNIEHTAYMTDLPKFYSYDLKTKQLTTITGTPPTTMDGSYKLWERKDPIIVASSDGEYAMADYKPNESQPYYVYDLIPGLSKWSISSQITNVQSQTYSETYYVVVGSLSEVTASLDKLYSYLTTVQSDTEAPTVSITSPTTGASVSGQVTISANASDNVGVAGVQFKLDGANLGAEDTTSPYTTSPYTTTWNTTLSSNGSHNLSAVARDAAGNTTTSSLVGVTVNNVTAPLSPTITSFSPSSMAEGDSRVITVTGSGFTTTNNTILFGTLGDIGQSTSDNGQILVFALPYGVTAGTYNISVRNANGTSNTMPFTITTATLTVRIVSPGAGEQVRIGSIYTINWTRTGNLPKGSKQYLSLFKGTLSNILMIYSIATLPVDSTATSYSWQVPTSVGGSALVPGADYGIQLLVRDNRGYVVASDYSAAPFTFSAPTSSRLLPGVLMANPAGALIITY